jgi:hypothetical protein
VNVEAWAFVWLEARTLIMAVAVKIGDTRDTQFPISDDTPLS